MTFSLNIKTAEDKAAEALAEAKDSARAWLLDQIASVEQAYIRDYSQGEIATWRKQEPAARAVITGNATAEQRKLLAARMAFSGETEGALAAKIVAKADALEALGMALSGIRTKAQDAIDAADTASEVDAAKVTAANELAAVTA